MKVLVCNNIQWNGYSIINLPLNQLTPTVVYNQEIVDKLLIDIPLYGLANPLLVVRATFDELDQFNKKWRLHVSHNTEYYICGGSCRLEAIKQLGYTHVSCVIIDSFDECYELQHTQRHDYIRWY